LAWIFPCQRAPWLGLDCSWRPSPSRTSRAPWHGQIYILPQSEFTLAGLGLLLEALSLQDLSPARVHPGWAWIATGGPLPPGFIPSQSAPWLGLDCSWRPSPSRIFSPVRIFPSQDFFPSQGALLDLPQPESTLAGLGFLLEALTLQEFFPSHSAGLGLLLVPLLYNPGGPF
jgi:hypothetical protein